MAKTQTEKLPPCAVLVAEDEPTVRALAESIIEELGYSTFSAANAKEALAVLENGAPVTVLFTDINMPDGPEAIDGLELVRRALEICPGLRVVYTTGGALTDGMRALFVEAGTFLPSHTTLTSLSGPCEEMARLLTRVIPASPKSKKVAPVTIPVLRTSHWQ